MKTFYTALLSVLLTGFSFVATAQCTNCTLENKNSNQTLNLKSGETLCITSNFNGSINAFPAGATICIKPGVTFSPSSINSPSGTINNYGTFSRTDLTVETGFILNNHGTLIAKNFTGNGMAIINNHGTASFANVQLPGGSSITNNGHLSATDKLTFNGAVVFDNSGTTAFTAIATAAGSTIHNSGSFVTTSFQINGANTIENIAGGRMDVNAISTLTENSTFDNSGEVYITSDFTIGTSSSVANATDAKLYITGNIKVDGNIANQGYFRVKGSVDFNGTSSLANHCAFITNSSVTNNSANFKNYGSFIVDAAPSILFMNNGSIYNSPTGFIQGGGFTNDKTVTGGGTFRFTGATKNQNNFGTDNDSYTINFYDATLAEGKNIMDEVIIAFGDVTSKEVAAKDTNMLLLNCGIAEQSPLPLRLTAFYGQLINNKVQLNWQVDENETGDYFEIQKSTNGISYKNVTLLLTSDEQGNANYSFTDATPNEAKTYYRLKMVNKDNSISYSSILSFQANAKAGSTLTLLQNPVSQNIKFNFRATTDAASQINVYNISGIKVNIYTARFYKGHNSISLPAGAWLPGLYVLEVISNGQRHTEKFIKQ